MSSTFPPCRNRSLELLAEQQTPDNLCRLFCMLPRMLGQGRIHSSDILPAVPHCYRVLCSNSY